MVNKMSEDPIEIQTRNEAGELKFFQTLREARDEAMRDKTVWKISFSLGEERVRLVRYGEAWMYEPIEFEETI